MSDAVRKALEIGPESGREDRLVDITTYGAKTGQPRRIEVVFHRIDGRWYLTGTPGPRAAASSTSMTGSRAARSRS